MKDPEFVIDREEEGSRAPSVALTGWETVVFVVTDEETGAGGDDGAEPRG